MERKHDQTGVSDCFTCRGTDPGDRRHIHHHHRSDAQMARQPGGCVWVYAWNCPTYFGEYIGPVCTPQYECPGLFSVEAGRRALFALPGVEYVARSRDTGTQPVRPGEKRCENHPESDRDQFAQSKVDDFLLCIPAALRFKKLSLTHPGNDPAQPHIHGPHVDRLCLVRDPGKWGERLFDEFNENCETTPTGVCRHSGR